MTNDEFSLGPFLRSKASGIALQTLCLAAALALLLLSGTQPTVACLAGVLMLLCQAALLTAEYLHKRCFYRSLQRALRQAEKARYITALVEPPAFLEGRAAYEALQRALLLSAEEAAALERDCHEYREYIDLWVHEAKTPLAAAKLISGRFHGPDAFALRQELERLEMQVENALYYARSTALVNDYRIQEVSLEGLAQEACKKNASLLVGRGIQPVLDESLRGAHVLADASWVSFVMGQILANAAKYGARSVRFSVRRRGGEGPHACTVLDIQDDGWGISAADVPQVFNRGFVGANGRAQGSATGMGLYLCALMCRRMGLGLSISSEEGAGTTLSISFPHDRQRQDFLTEA